MANMQDYNNPCRFHLAMLSFLQMSFHSHNVSLWYKLLQQLYKLINELLAQKLLKKMW